MLQLKMAFWNLASLFRTSSSPTDLQELSLPWRDKSQWRAWRYPSIGGNDG
jgi:hypothetical protein